MKKMLAIVLASAMLLSVAACGGGNTTESPASSAAEAGNSEEAAEKPETQAEPAAEAASGEMPEYVAATVVKAIGSTWFDSMGWEGDKWAARVEEENRAVIRNNYLGPTSQDSAAQLQVLADAIALNPDILCVVPIAADAVDEQLAIAKQNGATIVTHEGSGLKNADYNVDAFDPVAYGKHFAGLFQQYGGDTGKIAITVGSLTEVSHNQWAQALYEELQEKYPGWESVEGDTFIESGATDTAYQVGKQLIQKYPDLTAIFVGSASATMGFARAIEELGKTDDIILIGNASPKARADAWENGTLTHSCFWYPGYSAAAAYEVALRLKEGGSIQNGDDLGVEGFDSISIDGQNIYGSGWVDVTADNWQELIDKYDM